jgi:phosphatidylinositol alpha-mannosyltransferase
MKIGFVLDDTLDKSDGVQQNILTLGKWLSDQGHEIHYLVADTVRTDIANVHSLGRFINLKFNQNNVRTPHVQLPYSPFLAKQIIQNAGDRTAVIGTFHILPASRLHEVSNHALRILLGKSLARFDKVVAVSEPAVHFARSAYGIVADYVPNPVNLSAFRSGRRLGKYNVRKLNIVFLGRLVQRKGILELINAYNLLPDEIADKTRLIICGKGPLKTKAKSMIAPGRNVTFAGFVSEKEKPDYLASADIAVFPSTGGESFGIVLVEAMAAGSQVVIGGNNPGYKSVLGEQPYLLFNPRDTKSFADHLQLFIEDSKMRERMHEWQEHAVGQYDVSVVGEKLISIYNQALHERAVVR